MLLALDVGNLTISVGLFDNQGELKFLAVLDTDKSKTADQIAIDLMNLFQLYHYDLKAVDGSIFWQTASAGGARRENGTQYPHGDPQSAGGGSGLRRRGGNSKI